MCRNQTPEGLPPASDSLCVVCVSAQITEDVGAVLTPVGGMFWTMGLGATKLVRSAVGLPQIEELMRVEGLARARAEHAGPPVGLPRLPAGLFRPPPGGGLKFWGSLQSSQSKSEIGKISSGEECALPSTSNVQYKQLGELVPTVPPAASYSGLPTALACDACAVANAAYCFKEV
jgi:hypothetical protein